MRTQPFASPQGAVDTIAALVGAPVTVRCGLPWIRREGADGAFPDWPLGVVLESGAHPVRAVLELDGALALWAVARALGAPGPDDGGAGAPLSEGERGVLAYLAARAIAAADTGWRVHGVRGDVPGLRQALGDGPTLVWPADVRYGDARGWGRLWMAEAALDALPPRAPQPRPATLRVPMILAVEAGWARLPWSELRTVRPGDAIVLDEAHCRPGDAAPRVCVRPVGARRTRWWCTASAAGLALESVDRTVAVPTGEGRRMNNGNDTATLIDRTGDAPVEVTVEMARFTLPLEELGAVQPGEVLLTGRVVGERVVLRAGDRVFATGELVDVEGEVGVRVLQLE